MTFEQAKARQRALEADVARASQAWRAIPGAGSGAMGLTPDSVKFAPDYRSARVDYQRAHDALRAFNGAFVRTYARELREERRARRAAGML